ncbi:hypothetical protein MYSTI_06138 [Myxococcus stipitatus DSM 14675]|uniref:Uncharacterized protein n=2 Tax=Myxococcus stipitatus TaxID=83455 RepID=L7UER6_MYXSD|nr:hypothetical protein MYSTI_06138 [Myxococcus stipitatus DSM 14675]
MLLLLLCAQESLAAESLESLALKVYRGTDGQSIEVVTLAPREASEVVLRIQGTDSEQDGLSVRGKARSMGRGIDFVVRHRGADWVLLSQRAGDTEAFVPGKPSFRVKFNQEATDKASASEVLSAHLLQRESGRLAAFEKKAWPYLEKKYTARATEAMAALSKACGTSPSFTFDWKTFDDAVMAELDVWAACAPLATRARARCATVKEVTVLTCRFGPALALERGTGTLVFTTTPGGATEGPSFLEARLQ